MKTETNEKFTVWIGGIPDAENVDKSKALEILKYWESLGYDDVIIESEGKQ